MDDIDTTLPELSQLVERRLALVRRLAGSLESSTPALTNRSAPARPEAVSKMLTTAIVPAP